jgi:hypothetical protein
MKLPARVGPFEARLLAEVVSELSGAPAPAKGRQVTDFLERAEPSHLLDAARHLCLRQPERFPPELVESIALGARPAPPPQLHRVVLADWEQHSIRPEGSLAERLARLGLPQWSSEDLVPELREGVRAQSRRLSEAMEAVRKGGGSLVALAEAIEETFRSLSVAYKPLDPAANPWGEAHAETWQYTVAKTLLARDHALKGLKQLLSVFAPERSALLHFEASGLRDPFEREIEPVKLGTRARREVLLAHEAVARRVRGEPRSMLLLSQLLGDLLEGRPPPLRYLAGRLAFASERLLFESKDSAEHFARRLDAVVRLWPKPPADAERDAELATARTALERIATAWLPPGEGPLSAPIRRVLWTKGGTLHKVELDGGTIAFVRRPVDKVGQAVRAGHEVAVSLLHQALGSDRAPFAIARPDGAGELRTLTREVAGYRSKLERPFDLEAMLAGPQAASVATVAFVDLISAASDLHPANLGTDATGELVAVDRELSFAPRARLPSGWCGVRELQFPPALLTRARSWTRGDLHAILAPAGLPARAADETYDRLQQLLASLDPEGRLELEPGLR